MKVIICGSITACAEIKAAEKLLLQLGHEVEIPVGCKDEVLRGRTEVATAEKADDKIKHVSRGHNPSLGCQA